MNPELKDVKDALDEAGKVYHDQFARLNQRIDEVKAHLNRAAALSDAPSTAAGSSGEHTAACRGKSRAPPKGVRTGLRFGSSDERDWCQALQGKQQRSCSALILAAGTAMRQRAAAPAADQPRVLVAR